MIWIKEQIKYSSCSMYGISHNDNIFSVLDLNSLINFTSDQKQFSFHRSDINCIVNRFGYDILTGVNVQYWNGNILFDAGIWDNKNSVCIWGRIFKKFVKLNKNQKRVFYKAYKKQGKLYLDGYLSLQWNFWFWTIVCL